MENQWFRGQFFSSLWFNVFKNSKSYEKFTLTSIIKFKFNLNDWLNYDQSDDDDDFSSTKKLWKVKHFPNKIQSSTKIFGNIFFCVQFVFHAHSFIIISQICKTNFFIIRMNRKKKLEKRTIQMINDRVEMGTDERTEQNRTEQITEWGETREKEQKSVEKCCIGMNAKKWIKKALQ